jgi:lipopolysaccharide export system protein LptC
MTVDHDIGPSPEVIERRRRAAQRWKRRSRAIQRWRKVLPVVIGVVFGALLLWIVGRGLLVKLTTPSQSGNAVVKMTNPRFYGRDSKNHAFVVAAQSAERRQNGQRQIVLIGPSLTLDAENPEQQTRVQATRGVYREQQRQVSLEGGVSIANGRGYSFTAPRAVIDTQKGHVTGNQGVQGQGPLGRIAASQYGVYDGGRRMVFSGGVRARIDQPAKPK